MKKNITNKNNKLKEQNSELLSEILEEISEISLKKTRGRMKLAARIKDSMLRLEMSNTDLAEKLNKNKSVITKWLSGTQNFTHDTLVEIEDVLDIKLINSNNSDENLIKPDYNITLNIRSGNNTRTFTSKTPTHSINDYPVVNGDC